MYASASAESSDDSVVKVEDGVTVGGEGGVVIFSVCVCDIFVWDVCNVLEWHESV